MVNKLKALRVHEVSGVDHPANRRTFLIAKGATTMADQTNILDSLRKGFAGLFGLPEVPTLGEALGDVYEDSRVDEICCALSDAIDTVLDAGPGMDKRTAVIGLLQQFLDQLDGEGLLKAAGILKADKKISGSNMAALNSMKTALDKLIADASGAEPTTKDDDIEAAAKAAKKKPPAAAAGADPEPTDDPADAEEDDPMEKTADVIALEKRATDLETAIAKGAADLTKATEDLAKERALRLDGEYLAKAREIGPVPGSTFEQTAAMLKTVAGNEELAKAYEAQLRASAEIVKQSALLSEVGKSATGGTGNATVTFMAKAQELAKSASIGIADALVQVAKSDPAGYDEHVRATTSR